MQAQLKKKIYISFREIYFILRIIITVITMFYLISR